MQRDLTDQICGEVRQCLYEYIERELENGQLRDFDDHVANCPRCENLLTSYRNANETVQQHILKEVNIPGDLRYQIIQSLNMD